jgi:hypothetical protein
MTDLSKKTTKLEKRLKVLLGGYMVRFKISSIFTIPIPGHSKQYTKQASRVHEATREVATRAEDLPATGAERGASYCQAR